MVDTKSLLVLIAKVVVIYTYIFIHVHGIEDQMYNNKFIA